MTGSAPGSALFFVTYDQLKQVLQRGGGGGGGGVGEGGGLPAPVARMMAASLAELVSVY